MQFVGFDFDHTLGIDNKLERRAALQMLADFASSEKAMYDPAEAERAVDETLLEYRSDSVPVETAIAGFLARFVEAGDRTVEFSEQFRDRVLQLAPASVEALAGVRELFAALDKMGVRYAILTNGWSPLQEEKARLIGFEGPVFVSERIGARKPGREAFEFLAKHFDAPLDAVWYVGDEPQIDCAAARSFGMTAVWFDWEAKVYPQELMQPDYTIRALSELPALLQGHA